LRILIDYITIWSKSIPCKGMTSGWVSYNKKMQGVFCIYPYALWEETHEIGRFPGV